jgi:glycosyltransferase involved in cell wall biosynthesis
MRILHVTQTYYPFLERGGPTVKVRAIAEGLQKRGHQNTVLTSWYGPPSAASNTVMDGVSVIYLRALITYRATTLNARLLTFCREHIQEFDVIHIYGIYDLLGPAIARAARRRGTPYLLEPLGMSRPIDRSFRLKRAWHRTFGKALFRHAAMIITTSQQEQKELRDDGWPREHVTLRYNGIDLDDFANLPAPGMFRKQWAIPPDEPLILFLGRLIPRKGVDLLIEAFAAACPALGRLVIAGPEGEPNLVEEMRKLAQARGIDSRTIFTGPLYADQKKSALVDCDLFVLPSRYENFANSVAEAIACGRPVIISDCCGISEFVEGQAGLVIPRNVTALTEALRLLLSNPALYNRFQSACAAVAARLSWREMLDVQETLYAQAMARSSQPEQV